jgi:16S rRNA (adenine(1408)-N(1))-methyltransferase
VAVDLGTGDGRSVLRLARREPGTLVIGIDPDVASMRRAAGKAARDRRANALFVVASVESLPAELEGVADHVSILFPWGSLLRGVVAGVPGTLAPIAGLLRPGAEVIAMWSIADRDRGHVAIEPLAADDLALAAARCGLVVIEQRMATPEEIDETGSTWAKRLRASRAREVTLLRARRG